jgi:hypothetical protein
MALTRVTSKVIQDGTISTADLSTASKSSISGSFRGELSSSVHLRQVATTVSGSWRGELSSSVYLRQVASTISGSIPQALSTTSSPTFNNITATGTLTAQEIHTEFTSASIVFTSGSTIFGNSSDDVHSMTGSLNVSGSITMADGDLSVTDDVVFGATATVETGLNLESGTFTIKNATSDSNGLKISQGGSDASNILNHYNGTLNLGVANSVDMTLKGGNVGIGTNDPSKLLHLNATDASPELRISSGSAIAQMAFSSGNGYFLRLGDASNNEDVMIRSYGDTVFNGGGNVLIGTTDSDARLMVKKIDGTAYGHFVTIEGDTTDNNNYPGISFKAGTLANAYPEIGLGNGGLMFSIAGGYHSSNYNNRTKIELNGSDGHIRFMTGGDPAAEKMRIESGGDVGIGTDNPDTKLVVAGAFQGNASDAILNTQGIHIDDTTTWSNLHSSKPTGGGINFSGVYNSSNAQVIFAGIRGLKENNTDGNYDGALILGTIANGGNLTERMRISSTGTVTTTADIVPGADVQMGTARGISFSNASDTATGETVQSSLLDDYEEGTYTINITGTSADGWTNKASYGTAGYVKIGSMVTVSARYETSSADAGRTGTMRFNLPFTVSDLTDNASGAAGSITVNRTGHSLTRQLTAITFDNVAYFNVQIANESGGTETYIDASDIDGTFEGHFCITFRAA